MSESRPTVGSAGSCVVVVRILGAIALASASAVLTQSAVASTSTGMAADVPRATGSEPLPPEVVVTGYRQSLQLAQSKKRTASQLIDSVFAAEIGKLPDTNTAEALQRVPGVQINTDLGEGSTVTVRGLNQVETLLNGRETFSAAGTRGLNFEFIPAELLSHIDIYKTQSADLLEGGIGGTIDVHTRRPFDFDRLTANAAVLGNYGDLAQELKPQLSALVSDRRQIGSGEVGALFSVSSQERALQEDYISAGAPTCYGLVLAGVCTTQTIGPNGFYNPQFTAKRQRTGLDGVLQWRAGNNLEIAFDASYVKFATPQLDYGTFPLPNSALTRSATTLYPGTDLIQSTTYLDQPLRTLSINRRQRDTHQQLAIAARWHTAGFTVKLDISHLDTAEQLDYRELDLVATLPTFTIDTSGSPPAARYSGVDLSNIANYNFAGLTDSVNSWNGRETAYQLDVSHEMNWRPITRLAVGARYADLADGLTPVRYFNGLANGPAAKHPELIQANPLGSAFRGSGATTISNYLAVNPSLLQNLDAIIGALGLTTYPTVQTQGIYAITEQDSAAYLQVDFATNTAISLDGNIGLRLVHTTDLLTGTETINGPSTVLQPIQVTNEYTNLLPSFNSRAHLTDDLLLRFSAYRSLTRPEFVNLNPGSTLVPANLTGSQGNPQLAPFRAVSYELALEWYFAPTGNLYADAFYKKVQGFPFTTASQQVVNGQTYIISQPVNSGAGRVEGIEAGYQQLDTPLPGPLAGLGLQTNVTYVTSRAPTSVAGYMAPLPNLSQWSYNIVAIYEHGPWSGRLAYFWRSRFLQSISVAAGIGVVPVESTAFSQLAAALDYRLNDHLFLSLAGTNLTRARHQTYFGSVLSPNATYIDDRQYIAGVRYRY
jgi:iron complex outermembrane receptor protein